MQKWEWEEVWIVSMQQHEALFFDLLTLSTIVVAVKATVLIVLTAAGWKKATIAIDFFSNSQGDGPAE